MWHDDYEANHHPVVILREGCMTKRNTILLIGTILGLSLVPLPPSNGLTLVALADKAGLPYPEDAERSVFLKQASVILEAQSRWASIEGHQPWHSVRINQTATYVLENTGTEKTINVTFPMLTHHTQSGNGLVFQVD